MNKITINFTTCSPAPSGGYKVYYRVVGTGMYIFAGTFYSSPAIFYDHVNPAGTCYEGYIASSCGDKQGNHIPFETCGSVVLDDSSCGVTFSQETESLLLTTINYDLHVEGHGSVDLVYHAIDRPNRFSVYEDGFLIITSGWKGYGPYTGPWGSFLSTAENGTLTFNPIPGKTYALKVEAGNAGPPPYDITDNFSVLVVCK